MQDNFSMCHNKQSTCELAREPVLNYRVMEILIGVSWEMEISIEKNLVVLVQRTQTNQCGNGWRMNEI